MTDTNQLPEPELGYIKTDKSNQPAFSARQMREAMRARTQVQGEPFAWVEHHKGGDNLVWDEPGGSKSPLYTTPQPAQATQAEVTDEQIAACVKRASTYGLPFVGLLNPGGTPSDFSKRFTAEILALHTATQPCGHPASLVIRSAESGEVLYCEACDDKSGRRDAEMREGELLEANQKLRDEILALRPERVPMTYCEVNEAFDAEWRTSYTDFKEGIRAAEAHHGITAQAKKEAE